MCFEIHVTKSNIIWSVHGNVEEYAVDRVRLLSLIKAKSINYYISASLCYRKL